MNIEEIKEHYKAGEWTRQNDRFHYDPQEEKIGYLLSLLEQAEKALEYYANLNQNAYHDATEGELYSDWWARQSVVAIEALQAIRKGD